MSFQTHQTVVDQLCEDPEFPRLYRSGVSSRRIADMYDVSTTTVRAAARRLGLVTPYPVAAGDLLEPPSDEEEKLSMSSLDLAPTIEALAQEVRERAYEKKLAEESRTTYFRVYKADRECRPTRL